jgi:hypothetical protein
LDQPAAKDERGVDMVPGDLLRVLVRQRKPPRCAPFSPATAPPVNANPVTTSR